MKIKKAITLLLAAVILLSMAACGGGSPPTTSEVRTWVNGAFTNNAYEFVSYDENTYLLTLSYADYETKRSADSVENTRSIIENRVRKELKYNGINVEMALWTPGYKEVPVVPDFGELLSIESEPIGFTEINGVYLGGYKYNPTDIESSSKGIEEYEALLKESGFELTETEVNISEVTYVFKKTGNVFVSLIPAETFTLKRNEINEYGVTIITSAVVTP